MSRVAVLALLLALSGCGAALPAIMAFGGAAAGVARLDTATLDWVEHIEGREARPVGACAASK